jgi:hypothetical protein
MALENVRVAEETLDPNGPLVTDGGTAPEFALHHFRWYVIGTNEPVTFADKAEARQYLTDQYVGDFVEMTYEWGATGYITDITDDMVRIYSRREQNAWRFDRATFVDGMMTWRRR